jgi:hypothetical protein
MFHGVGSDDLGHLVYKELFNYLKSFNGFIGFDDGIAFPKVGIVFC